MYTKLREKDFPYTDDWGDEVTIDEHIGYLEGLLDSQEELISRLKEMLRRIEASYEPKEGIDERINVVLKKVDGGTHVQMAMIGEPKITKEYDKTYAIHNIMSSFRVGATAVDEVEGACKVDHEMAVRLAKSVGRYMERELLKQQGWWE